MTHYCLCGLEMDVDSAVFGEDMEWVQLHMSGLAIPDGPDAKTKLLAAEALRAAGGLVRDASGQRFAHVHGRRAYVTGEDW